MEKDLDVVGVRGSQNVLTKQQNKKHNNGFGEGVNTFRHLHVFLPLGTDMVLNEQLTEMYNSCNFLVRLSGITVVRMCIQELLKIVAMF